MRTKSLLAIAAMSGLFAACSQEEAFESSVDKANPLAGRAIVGNVEFVSDGAETRYDSETGKVTDGDELGLYLMDEFRGWNEYDSKGELDNANHTLFEYQSNWWTMYQLTNNIQSNYGYEFIQNQNAWINRASQLVEGNYLVMLPKNDVATNRRDLWREIKPVVDLKHSSTRDDKYYVNRENQFMLDYKQIYRDQKKDENGKLTMGVKLRYILTYAKFTFENQAANQFIAQKLVFKAPAGKALPTVAYVKPAEMTKNNVWVGYDNCPSWVARELNKQEVAGTIDEMKDECGNVVAKGLYNKDWFTQNVARGMVQYATTEREVPYGLENDAVAYEYTFNFPDEGEGGVRLEGNTTASKAADRVMAVSIALPAFNMGDYDWTDMEVVVYGKMFDPTINDLKGGYRNGILRKMPGKDNAEFTLDDLKLWESGMAEIPTANLHFDDQYFYQDEEIRVETTNDLINLINARLTDATTTKDVNFEVYPYGKGLEITDEVVKLIDNYKNSHKVAVNLTFKNSLTQNVTPVILQAENCINMFKYNGVNVTLDADQTIIGNVTGINQLVNNADLAVNGNLDIYANLINNANITVNQACITVRNGYLENKDLVTLNDGAEIDGGVQNHAQFDVNGNVVVGSITNNNTCVNCANGSAVITVNETSVLVVNLIINGDNGTIENNGTINVVGRGLENYGELNNYGEINAELLNHNKLDNYGLITQRKQNSNRSINYEGGVIVNHGTSAEEYKFDAEIRANREATNHEGTGHANFENQGTIYNYGVFMDLINEGLVYQFKADKAKLYIMRGSGSINVTGCTAGTGFTEIVWNENKQTFIYDVNKNLDSNNLAGQDYLNIINVMDCRFNVTANAFKNWTNLNISNSEVNFASKYTSPESVKVVVNGGKNSFSGVGANFTNGSLEILNTKTHVTIEKGCTMKFKTVKIDGDLKVFGDLKCEKMGGMGLYNGEPITTGTL